MRATVGFKTGATQEITNINLPNDVNSFLNTDSVSEALAPAQTSPLAAAATETATSITRSIGSTCERIVGRYAAELLQGLGWAMAALYFIGAAALGVVILYHTFR
jgi:hypothetical protein